MTTNPNEMFTASEIEQLKSSGGTISKSFKDSKKLGAKPELTSVQVHSDATLPKGGGWGSAPERITAPGQGQKIERPSIIRGEDGKPVTQTKVVAPSVGKYNVIAAERALKELDEADARKAEAERLNPEKLLASLNALDRQVRKLQKQIKTLEARDNA